MIICVNCSAETKSKMDSLIGKNVYRDYSELISMAVDNLWMLEQELAEKGSLIIGETSTAAVASPMPWPEKDGQRKVGVSQKAQPQSLRSQMPQKSAPPQSVRIPELFVGEELENLKAEVSGIAASTEPEERFTLDRWIFGQYNKLLPIKANCRALLRHATKQRGGMAVEEVAQQIAEAAALLGDYLAEHDRRHQISRDDSLATAFPRSGLEAEKSRARYANQFVGSVNSQGILSGLLSDYRMVTLTPGLNDNLMLTEPAVEFAKLTNPILDNCQTNPTQKFSQEEVTFMLAHIRDCVPTEAFAFRVLIEAIANGADTPDTLNESMSAHVPAITNRSLSPSFLTSQRSGALSRMADLGLIVRERKGVRVLYMVTEQGRRLIDYK